MRELLRVVAEVIAEAILYMILFLAISSTVAWAVSSVAGVLHNSGLTDVPALPFWQSYLIVVFIYLQHAVRSNK